MKRQQRQRLVNYMESILEEIDIDGGNPEFCYENLPKDMAAAAEAVYNACMAGQKFARKQRS